jgi:hypothetical protein
MPLQSRQAFSNAIVGSHPATSHHDTKPSSLIAPQSISLFGGAPQRHLRFQPHGTRTFGHSRHHARDTGKRRSWAIHGQEGWYLGHAPEHYRTVTYGRIIVSIHPQKAEVKRTRLTVGGNLIDYPGDVSTKTAGLTTAKVLFNSVISTPNAKFMGIYLKNFYLNTPLDRYECMKMPIALIPPEIIKEYNLQTLVHHGFV